jgi:purine nucleoside phosphorylase
VGGITNDLEPGALVIPHQIIDYTWARQHTYFEEDLAYVTHIDFTEPYCTELRELICRGASVANIQTVNHGVYGAVQGPRLETAAEIDRLERDGCTVVGMTGMPEAALARELELCYASINVVANKAAGRGEGQITLEQIRGTLASAMLKVRRVIDATIEGLVEPASTTD